MSLSHLQRAIRDREGNVMFSLETPGPLAPSGHRHRLQVVRLDFDKFYVVADEPNNCGCSRAIELSELIHVLINTTDEEHARLLDREVDPQGHSHHAAVTP